ncbi:MAG: hypothetical protein E7496_12450 [Ruminococcus sp.]|nr:hypothetical protein [Ruminococcus sp.]
MTYREFYIRITAQKIAKTAPDGNSALCNGFLIQICDSKDKNTVIDFFTAAAGFELLENSVAEAEQLAKDYINMEAKKLRQLLDEYHSFQEQS